MKWLLRLSFITLWTLAINNLTLNVNGKVITPSLLNHQLSPSNDGDKSPINDELDKSEPTIKESLPSSSQLMPFFYVGDIDQTSTSKPLITKINPKSDKKEIRLKKDKDVSSRPAASSSTTPPPFLIKTFKRIKATKIPVLFPLQAPLSSTRRVFNDNELLSSLGDEDDKPHPPSYKLLWYIPPRSSSSFPFSSSSSPSRSSFSPGYVPLFKYNSMLENKHPLPPTGYMKTNYYHPEYPSAYASHYSIYHPSSLSFPSFPDFPTPSSNSIDEDIDLHDDDLDADNGYQIYGKIYSSPPPPSTSFTSTLYSPHHHPPPPMFPSGHHHHPHHHQPSFSRSQYAGPSVGRRFQRPKTSDLATKDILQDPDIEQLLSTFDLERSFEKGQSKGKHYRPRKSYDDNLPMNGKYSEDHLGYKMGSRGWGGFINSGHGSLENTGRYGGRSNFKPYYDYYKNFRVSPYSAKESVKSRERR